MKKLLILLTLAFCFSTAIANNSNNFTTTVKPIHIEADMLKSENNDFLPTSHVTKQLTIEITGNGYGPTCQEICQATLFSCLNNGGSTCYNDYVDCIEFCSTGGSGF